MADNQEYNVRQLLEMGACTNCQACTDVCPAVTASSGRRTFRGLSHERPSRASETAHRPFQRLFRKKPSTKEDLKHFSDTVFRCTLCGNCQEVCPVGIHLKDLWLSLRQDMVHSKSYPKKINMIRDNLAEDRNVFAEDNEERAEWVEDMRDPPDDNYIKDQSEVVYFTGCTAAYFPLAQKIPMALAEILDRSGWISPFWEKRSGAAVFPCWEPDWEKCFRNS
jgi:heterodisulfide reductase subunit D